MNDEPRHDTAAPTGDDSPTSWRSIGERGLHLIWTVHFILTLALCSAAFGIILFDVMIQLLSPPRFNYMIETATLLMLGGAANVPIALTGRYYGVLWFHFLRHESYLVSRTDEVDEAFVGVSSVDFIRLVEQLENATPMDRQPARRQLREWLEVHHQDLSLQELEHVEEQFNYLFQPEWKDRFFVEVEG
jgi:hypothetical protein